MKLISSIFFALLFVVSTSFAQTASKHSFKDGVKGIAFDSIELVHYASQPDGNIKVYLYLKRTGAIQKVTGSLMSGGKDLIELEAFGIITFSKDMKVLDEKLNYIKPEGIVGKQFNILATNDPLRAETIATHEDCISKWDIIDKYPELTKEEEVKEVARPELYYGNTISYSMLGLKPKSFDIVTHKLKTEESEAQKDFLSRTLSTPGNYDKSAKSTPIEPYRNSDKKNYWLKASEPVCDPISGTVYAHNGHMMRGQMGNRSTEFIQEFVVFDKEGTETARTEIKFEEPHALNLREVLITETPENSLYEVDGVVHVYNQNYGFGYKKLNPNPNKKAYKYYQWDNAGELVAQVDFEVPVERVNIVRAFHAEDKVNLLATAYEPSAFYSFCFEKGEMTCSETLDEAHPLAKGLGFTPSELGKYKWKYQQCYTQAEGPKCYLYEINQEVSTTAQPGTRPTVTVTPKGFVMLRVDNKGKLTHTQHIMRPENADSGYKSTFSCYPTDGGDYVTVIKDPLVGGTSAVNIYKISPSDLQKSKIVELSGAEELQFKQLLKDNSIIFLSKDAVDKIYQLMLVRM